MTARVLLTAPIECKIEDGIAYLDLRSNGETIEAGLAVPLLIKSVDEARRCIAEWEASRG